MWGYEYTQGFTSLSMNIFTCIINKTNKGIWRFFYSYLNIQTSFQRNRKKICPQSERPNVEMGDHDQPLSQYTTL